jgi:hypothetical protein
VSDPDSSYFYFTEAVAGKAFIIATGPASIAGDHGGLSGLADDDHMQYSLVDGTRAYTGEVEFPDGSLGTPAIRFASDLDLGISRAGDNSLLIQARDVSATHADGSESLFTADKKGFAVPGHSKAQAFYFTNGGGISSAGVTFLDFELGGKTLLRPVAGREIVTGETNQSGVSMAHKVNGVITETFRTFAGAGNLQLPALNGTINWHMLELASVTNRVLVMGPGTPIQNQLVLHRDGKITMGFESLDYTKFYYHLNSNGPVLAKGGFYVTDTDFPDKRGPGPKIRASLETSGLFMSDKGKWDKFGLESDRRVLAPAFYITESGTVVNDLAEDFISFQIELPVVKLFFLDSDAVFPYELTQASLRCQSGSAVVGFYIRAEGEGGTGTSIVGLDPFYVSPIRRREFPISANVVNVGSELYISVDETSAATDIRGTLKFRRRGAA